MPCIKSIRTRQNFFAVWQWEERLPPSTHTHHAQIQLYTKCDQSFSTECHLWQPPMSHEISMLATSLRRSITVWTARTNTCKLFKHIWMLPPFGRCMPSRARTNGWRPCWTRLLIPIGPSYTLEKVSVVISATTSSTSTQHRCVKKAVEDDCYLVERFGSVETWY
jgi:hypothetical protein